MEEKDYTVDDLKDVIFSRAGLPRTSFRMALPSSGDSRVWEAPYTLSLEMFDSIAALATLMNILVLALLLPIPIMEAAASPARPNSIMMPLAPSSFKS